MARYQVILAYDGTHFLGSQRQANSRTVQGELEKALCKLGWSNRSVLIAGRTDTGVHASGQVAAFDLEWSHADDDLLRALNANLPADLAVRETRVAAEDFHPRFDAVSRRYRYRLFSQPIRDPLREKLAWRTWPTVDGALLAQTASLLTGMHDFAAFGSPTSPKGTTVRTVMKAEWRPVEKDEWQFEIQADAFLYRMVRRLVFVQVAIAQGKAPADAVAGFLAGQAVGSVKELPAGLAPAHGLTLVEVTY
jgi:tRNA pseudouridine38-40 synthase